MKPVVSIPVKKNENNFNLQPRFVHKIEHSPEEKSNIGELNPHLISLDKENSTDQQETPEDALEKLKNFTKRLTAIYNKKENKMLLTDNYQGIEELEKTGSLQGSGGILEHIDEIDIPSYVHKKINESIENILVGEFFQALHHLKYAELVVNAYTRTIESPASVMNNEKLIISNNLAVAFYRVGLAKEAFFNLEKFATHVTALIKATDKYNLSDADSSKNIDNLSKKIRLKRLRVQADLNMCIILSEMGRHEEGIVHAKESLRSLFTIFIEQVILALTCYKCINFGNVELTRDNFRKRKNATKTSEGTRQNNKPNLMQSTLINFEKKHFGESTELSPKPHYLLTDEEKDELANILNVYAVFDKVCESLEDISQEFYDEKKMQIIEQILQNFTIPEDGLDYSKILAEADKTHPIFQANLLGILHMKPIDLDDMIEGNQIQNYEIKPQRLLETLCFLSATFYAISTEHRFIEQTFSQDTNTIKDRYTFIFPTLIITSEIYLGKSLEVAYTFLPHELPFVMQIFNVFSQLHAVHRTVIPEDSDGKERFKYLRPLNGIHPSGYIIPIIRKREIEKQSKSLVKSMRLASKEKDKIIQRLPHTTAKSRERVAQLEKIYGSNSNNVKLALLPQAKKVQNFDFNDISVKKSLQPLPAESVFQNSLHNIKLLYHSKRAAEQLKQSSYQSNKFSKQTINLMVVGNSPPVSMNELESDGILMSSTTKSGFHSSNSIKKQNQVILKRFNMTAGFKKVSNINVLGEQKDHLNIRAGLKNTKFNIRSKKKVKEGKLKEKQNKKPKNVASNEIKKNIENNNK